MVYLNVMSPNLWTYVHCRIDDSFGKYIRPPGTGERVKYLTDMAVVSLCLQNQWLHVSYTELLPRFNQNLVPKCRQRKIIGQFYFRLRLTNCMEQRTCYNLLCPQFVKNK